MPGRSIGSPAGKGRSVCACRRWSAETAPRVALRKRAVLILKRLYLLPEVDVRLALHAAALHGLTQRRILQEPAGVLLGAELERNDHVIGVVRRAVEPVPGGSVLAPARLVLVEDRLPGVVVPDPVVYDQDRHSSFLNATEPTVVRRMGERAFDPSTSSLL